MIILRRKILEALGITFAICMYAAILIYGICQIGTGTNPVLGCWIVGIEVFVGIFAAVYFGRD